MKRLLAAALLAISSLAFATTYVPIQLLNPAGSTTGQVIVFNGSNWAPGSVPVGGLAAMAANTVVANATSSSATPTALAMPSTCASGSLQWTSGTGFVCSTAISATTLAASGGTTLSNFATVSYTNALFSVSDTSGTGSSYVAWRNNGTNVWDWNNNSSTSVFSIDRYVSGTFADRPISISNSTGVVTFADGISGVTSGVAAAAGIVGEYPNGSTSGTSLTSGQIAIATSKSLTPGQYLIWGSAVFAPGTSPSFTNVQAGISASSTAYSIANAIGSQNFPANTAQTGVQLVVPPTIIEVSTTTTYYLIANATFSASTMSVTGYIQALRVR
jgi:hypothetical protein